MATAVRYWRVRFWPVKGGSDSSINLNTVTPYDASGVALLTGVTLSGNNHAGLLSALIDSDGSTYTPFAWGWNDYAARNITFTYTDPVLWDYVVWNVSNQASVYGSIITPAVPLMIESSADNVTWVVQAVHERISYSQMTDYRLAAITSSMYYVTVDRKLFGGVGGIYGIVSEDGVALPDRPVHLFERTAMQRIGYTTTDINGGYSFTGLNESNEYTVMSVDPSGPPYKNALIWDRITPISARGAQVPRNGFWARRLRDPACGPMQTFNGFLDGATYNYFKPNEGNGIRLHSQTGLNIQNYITPDTVLVPEGTFMLAKSNRDLTSSAPGLTMLTEGGYFGNIQAGDPKNYGEFTFEYVFKPPAAGEQPLIIIWTGSRDSDDYTGFAGTWNGANQGSGPTLQVTQTTMYVRFPLGGANRATIRAQAPVVTGQVYHVVVTYKMDNEIKLYVNGALVQTTAIPGSGRIFATSHTPNAAITNWDYSYTGGGGYVGAIRRLQGLTVVGEGTGNPIDCFGYGWGGSVGHCGAFGRTMDATDVVNLYDSFMNPTTHLVPVTLAGYSAEVEADNPTLYLRCNDLSIPANTVGVRSLLGRKDVPFLATQSTSHTAGATPAFVGGTTAFRQTANNMGLYSSWAYTLFGHAFSFECFLRPETNFSNNAILFLAREYNASHVLYVRLQTNGKFLLDILDQSGTETIVYFNHTALSLDNNYHVVVTYDPWVTNQSKLYLNGALVDTQPASAIPRTNAVSNVSFMCNMSGTGPTIDSSFLGQYGEIALYAYALPADRVQAHYDARNA